MLQRFTVSARKLVSIASEEATALGHSDTEPEHLLLGALRCGGSAGFALSALSVGEQALRMRVAMRLPRRDLAIDGASLSVDAVWVLGAAAQIAETACEPQVGSGHILRALLEAPGSRDVLASCEVSAEAVRALVMERPSDGDEMFAATVNGFEQRAAARALMAVVLLRGPVAAWLAERGIDETAVERAFPNVEFGEAPTSAAGGAL